MATGLSPPGTCGTFLSPTHQNFPVSIPVPARGGRIFPVPVPERDQIPDGCLVPDKSHPKQNTNQHINPQQPSLLELSSSSGNCFGRRWWSVLLRGLAGGGRAATTGSFVRQWSPSRSRQIQRRQPRPRPYLSRWGSSSGRLETSALGKSRRAGG